MTNEERYLEKEAQMQMMRDFRAKYINEEKDIEKERKRKKMADCRAKGALEEKKNLIELKYEHDIETERKAERIRKQKLGSR